MKLDYKVTVYSHCGTEEGIYDGVEYRNYNRFNRYDTFAASLRAVFESLKNAEIGLSDRKAQFRQLV